ncbi:MFS transporter [Promicromonospora sp. NPDC023805]|uniref:MFS transporter n=1 Tax=Promicromonospora sp. NPDC023805 TaxID=3154696 RepID=UPI0034046E52
MLWTARAVSVLGDSLGLVALLVHLQAEAGAAIAVALLLLAGDCVPGLFGPVAGLISDRFGLRRVMIACEVVQGLLVLATAVALPPLPILLILVAARGIGATTFIAASRSAVPRMVDDDDLEAANSALGVGTYGLEALGPLIAAALFTSSGIRGVLLVDVATFAVSAVVLARLPLLGYLLLGRVGGRWPALGLLLVGFVVSSAGNLVTGLAGSIAAAMVLQTLRGAGIAALDVGVNTHLQRIVPPAVLGQAFGTLYGAIGLAAGLSYALGGLLLAATDARITFVVAGAGGLLVSAAAAVALRRAARRTCR